MSAAATDENDATVDRTASLVAPVTATVVTTAVRTVISATHMRCGARSIFAAPRAPGLPNTRATADAAVTMGREKAKQSAAAPTNARAIDATATRPRSAVTVMMVAHTKIAPTAPMMIDSLRWPA